jgi:guanine deaminase
MTKHHHDNKEQYKNPSQQNNSQNDKSHHEHSHHQQTGTAVMNKEKNHENEHKHDNKHQDNQHNKKQQDNKHQDKHHDNKHQHENKQQHGNKQHEKEDMSKHKEFMKRAIELSRKASMIEKSGGVFGAVIVKDGKIIAEGYNQVAKTKDPTWHAEMHAIREACKKLGTPHLEGCTLYSSAECCPMCLATAYWAHIDRIFVGASTADSLKYGDFADIDILDEIKKDPTARRITFTEIMRPEAVEVWKEFSKMPDRARY